MTTAQDTHAIIPGHGWMEHWFTLPEDELAATAGRLGILGLHPVRLHWCASEGDAAFRLADPPPATCLLPSARGDTSLGGAHLMAVSGAVLIPIAHRGRICGYTWEDSDATYAWISGIAPEDAQASPAQQTEQVFASLDAILSGCGLGFADVIRTWFFNHRILDWYGDFNRVRTAFFQHHGLFQRLVPASTCVGVRHPDGWALTGDAVVIRPKNDAIRITPVRSPLQGPATAYGSSFSRAVRVDTPEHRRVMISGTASIEPGGATVHLGDTAAQTRLTLDVLEAILLDNDLTWNDVTRSLLYLKSAADADLVQEVCRQRDLAIPNLVALEADVCRDNLLVEIELDACRGM